MVETSSGSDDKPYVVLQKKDSSEYRLFCNYDRNDLYWHRDHENRIVQVLMGEVQFQIDHELPRTYFPGEAVYIEKDTFHRVISDGTPFLLRIEFLDDLPSPPQPTD